ncbi:hypothetical protein KGF57_003426 [Candida theae]|uniref:Stationary phase protein 5 n=1 Tax=Candida theae TaxID=1198502 RepID=A0AAD5BDW0_9ASCO|nr:uncharacterized protein KGF57_003426 [Candida theae]KAI5956619.1 hypothetical protein KGF57_003426 [Candida theae]
MNIQRFSNLISIRTREISKRIQRALNEISENIQREYQQHQGQEGAPGSPRQRQRQRQRQPAYAPVPVPVPARNSRPNNPFVRQFSTSARAYSSNPNWTRANPTSWFQKYNLFLRKVTRLGSKSKILTTLNHGFLYHNFSQTYQNPFRLKIYQRNLKQTYRSLFNNLRERYQVYNKGTVSQEGQVLKTLRLNLSLSAENHHFVTRLAKTDSSASKQEKIEANAHFTSCFIAFPLNFSLNIPNETFLSEEVVDEMMYSVQRFETKLQSFKQDLHNLFELGELPMKYVDNTIRVYFPNCDKEKLENLCQEKGIVGGIIVEEESDVPVGEARVNPTPVDLLSSTNSGGSTYSSDILSTDSSEMDHHLSPHVIRPVEVPLQQVISVNEDYHWV